MSLVGAMVVVGVPPNPSQFHATSLIFGNKLLAGSLIGGIPETQQMLDYCADNNIKAEVEVITPEDYMGDVIGDLNSRRGQIQAMEERSGARVVKALVPLSEMFGYIGDLRSKTQGRANYSMVFAQYAEVPANVSKEIIAKATGE